jgi:RNA polymerase sigma-70 factor (ECF subfamily)
MIDSAACEAKGITSPIRARRPQLMPEPEAHLLARARSFEPEALGTIYDHYSPGIYRYARRLLGCDSLAEDCVGETFSRFLQALRGGGGPQDHLQAYLYRVAHNWITDHYRRQPPPPLELDENHPTSSAGVESQAGQSLEGARVRAALVRLTDEQRQVVTLRFLEGWDPAEVARAVQKPVGAVKSLQHRALAALRRMLVEDGASEWQT